MIHEFKAGQYFSESAILTEDYISTATVRAGTYVDMDVLQKSVLLCYFLSSMHYRLLLV